MKNCILFLLLFFSIGLLAQVRPDQFPNDTSMTDTDGFYTQEAVLGTPTPRKILGPAIRNYVRGSTLAYGQRTVVNDSISFDQYEITFGKSGGGKITANENFRIIPDTKRLILGDSADVTYHSAIPLAAGLNVLAENTGNRSIGQYGSRAATIYSETSAAALNLSTFDNFSTISMYRLGGTFTSPTAVPNNSIIGLIDMNYYDLGYGIPAPVEIAGYRRTNGASLSFALDTDGGHTDVLELTADREVILPTYATGLHLENYDYLLAVNDQGKIVQVDTAALLLGGGGGGLQDSTRLVQDSILVYYQGGVELGRDTIIGTGGGGTVAEPAAQVVFGTGASVDSDPNFNFDGGRLYVEREQNTSVDSAAMEVVRTYNGVAVSPIATAIFRNTGDVVGGSDYQNEVYLRLQAGTTADHRRYVGYYGYDGLADGIMGMNAQNDMTFYSAEDTVHMFFYHSQQSTGNTELNSTGTGAVQINIGNLDEPNRSATGLQIYDGVHGRNPGIQASGGNISSGYGVTKAGTYHLNVGGRFHQAGISGGGGINIEAPTVPSEFTGSYYGIFIDDPGTTSFRTAIRSRFTDQAGLAWNIYADGTAPNYFAGGIGLGSVTDPTENLDMSGNLRMRNGAAAGYIMMSDANGVASWVDTTGLFAGGVSTSKDTLYIVATGQSNIYFDAAAIGGDLSIDSSVFIYDWNTAGWVVANPNASPWVLTGTNHVAFQFAKNVSEKEDKVVFIVLEALGTQSITQWVPDSQPRWVALDSRVVAAGVTHADVFMFQQGETDTGMDDVTYNNNKALLYDQVRTSSWGDSTTIMLSGTPFNGTGAKAKAKYDVIMSENRDNDTRASAVFSEGLTSPDSLHYDGASIDILGRRYYNAYKATPYNYIQDFVVANNGIEQVGDTLRLFNELGSHIGGSAFLQTDRGLDMNGKHLVFQNGGFITLGTYTGTQGSHSLRIGDSNEARANCFAQGISNEATGSASFVGGSQDVNVTGALAGGFSAWQSNITGFVSASIGGRNIDNDADYSVMLGGQNNTLGASMSNAVLAAGTSYNINDTRLDGHLIAGKIALIAPPLDVTMDSIVVLDGYGRQGYIGKQALIDTIIANGGGGSSVWTESGGALYPATIGNKVLVGATSSSYKFSVQDANGGLLAQFKDTDSAHDGLLLWGDTNQGGISNSVGLVDQEAITLNNALDWVRVYAGGSEKFRVTSTDISVLTGDLSVSNTANTTLFVEDTDHTSTFNLTGLRRDGPDFTIGTYSDAGVLVNNNYTITQDASGANLHQFYIGGLQHVWIDDDGLGINIQSDGHGLDVFGTTRLTGNVGINANPSPSKALRIEGDLAVFGGDSINIRSDISGISANMTFLNEIRLFSRDSINNTMAGYYPISHGYQQWGLLGGNPSAYTVDAGIIARESGGEQYLHLVTNDNPSEGQVLVYKASPVPHLEYEDQSGGGGGGPTMGRLASDQTSGDYTVFSFTLQPGNYLIESEVYMDNSANNEDTNFYFGMTSGTYTQHGYTMANDYDTSGGDRAGHDPFTQLDRTGQYLFTSSDRDQVVFIGSVSVSVTVAGTFSIRVTNGDEADVVIKAGSWYRQTDL